VSLQSSLDAAQIARRQAEVAREETERRYRHLFEHSLGLICLHDLQGGLIAVNPAAARSLGYEGLPVKGLNLRDFLAADTRPLLDGYLTRIRQHGSDGGLMRVVARDGGEHVWLYRNTLYEEPDVPPYVLGHAVDITDRIRAERALRESEAALQRAYAELDTRVQERTAELQAANEKLLAEIAERKRIDLLRERAVRREQEANRLKDEFLATLSHELRTPLNAILGWARILSTRPLDESTLQALAVIERNARAQTRLIEDMLDVSRIVAGKLVLNLETISVPAVVGAALDAVRPAATQKEIRLREETAVDVRPIHGDAQRLQQAIGNLLSNAIKFTPRGGAVTTRLRQLRDSVEVTVSDTGVGIRDEVLPFVFDRFRQADSSTTRSHGGLGLGLAIVRHVVELHGGTASAESAGEDRGATFRVELPSRAGALETTPQEFDEPGEQESAPVLRGRLVLVVEDHDDARQLIAATLESVGATVFAAGSVREAIQLFERSRPDVVIADIGLPEEDGYTLLRRIRRLAADRGRQVPAIALTAYARAEDREQALAAGYQHHVTKPVDPQTLLRIVAATLGG
jgi:PAS domain S-box-containing protein